MKYLCKNNEFHNSFQLESTILTSLPWTKVVDRGGNILNFNPNATITHYRCMVCGDIYTRFQKGPSVSFHVGHLPMRECNPDKAFHKVDLSNPEEA